MGKGKIISRRRKIVDNSTKNIYDGELVVSHADESENLEIGSIIPFTDEILPENIKLGNIFSNTKTTEFDFHFENGRAKSLKLTKVMAE